ncbi:MAG: X2-like carbohydrate binding domain-containing protein, partial [Clostridia bacterium]|nr:X2-like carbohydrate binding domain-containing protein [Clostridia bacterium]
ALVGASVQLKKGANSIGGAVTTGANGAYTIPNAPGGTGYTIEVSYTGYDTGTIPSFDVIDAVMGKDITLSKTLPGATVDNVTVDGTTGTQIVATAIKITLANGAFKETIFDYNWFTNLPAGLTVSGSYSTDTVAVIFVSGTPTAACSDAMRITIPKGALRGGTADIVVTANPNAKWDITAPMPATYTATVINGTGGGAYTAGESVSITADAPAAGKQFKKWTANSDGVVFADKTAATTTFPMPAGAVTVTATYADIPNPPTPPAPSTPSAPSASTMAGGVAYTGNAYAGTWNGGTLTVQADCAKLTSVTVDGAQLRKDSDYTVDCGSTIIAFTPAYLATLRDGAHAIRVQFADGQYTGSFTTPFATAVMAIANVPATGSVPIAWALLALAAGLGLVLRRRRV